MMLARVAPKLRLRRREEQGDEEGEGEVRWGGGRQRGGEGEAWPARRRVYDQSKVKSTPPPQRLQEP